MFQGIFFEVFSLFTEIERNMIRERTKAALNSLKEKGIQLGRPKMNTYKNPKLDSNKDTIIKMLNLGVPQSKIARKFNVDIRTFYKFVNYHKLITNIKNSV
jgi:DNA invertase Pin-like site-specific DNA recombinase